MNSKGTEPEPGRLTLSWRNITVETTKSLISRSQKTILKNVSGHIERGELVAVMGTSGAGKTTLFNAIMFQNLQGIKLKSGSRFVNGVKMNARSMTSIAGYMLQDDIFIGSLTVREHMTFLANLRLGDEMTNQDRVDRVNELLFQMGLSKCADTVIGIRGRLKGISGGEMRRLCFASEVISDPQLLLLDEPTTGLDSWMAENIVNILRDMTNRGKSIMCVIHQPSSEVYKLFDRVLLLSEGQVAFMGSTKEADSFFNSLSFPCPNDFNPADHYIYKLSMTPGHENEYDTRVERICSEYKESHYYQAIESKIDEDLSSKDNNLEQNLHKLKPYKSSWYQQFVSCLWRSWKSIIKEPAVVRIRVIQNIVFATVVGIIYFDQKVNQTGILNINGVLFWTTMNQIFTTYSTVLNVFSGEIPIMKREHLNGLYRIDVYFMARQLADLPLFLLTPFIFMAIFYFLALPDNGAERFFLSTLIIILVVQTAVGLGYLAASCTANQEMALAIGPAVTTPLLVFGGIYGSNSTIPDWLLWMKFLSPWYYGNEAMEITQWRNEEKIPCEADDNICLDNGDKVLEYYSMDKDNLPFDLYMLVVLSVGMRLCSYLALLYRSKRPSSK